MRKLWKAFVNDILPAFSLPRPDIIIEFLRKCLNVFNTYLQLSMNLGAVGLRETSLLISRQSIACHRIKPLIVVTFKAGLLAAGSGEVLLYSGHFMYI